PGFEQDHGIHNPGSGTGGEVPDFTNPSEGNPSEGEGSGINPDGSGELEPGFEQDHGIHNPGSGTGGEVPDFINPSEGFDNDFGQDPAPDELPEFGKDPAPEELPGFTNPNEGNTVGEDIQDVSDKVD
ncbi:hypothetical protein L2725_18950, partial [Shewanella corallii]